MQEFKQLLLDGFALELSGDAIEAKQLYRRAAFLSPGSALPFTRLSIIAARALWGSPPSPRPMLSDYQPRVSMTSLGSNGRFGNQLLQYAYLCIYAKLAGCAIETPDWIGRDLFGCDTPLPSNTLPRLSDAEFDANTALLTGGALAVNVDLHGYFCFHTKYWKPFQQHFRGALQLRPEVEQWLDKAYNTLDTKKRTVVAIHIRHGDFGGDEFWIAPIAWYKAWLETIWNNLKQPLLFIATDNATITSAFREYNPLSIDNISSAPEDLNYLIDFYVLTRADFIATSNSTFSFVAAMLNTHACTMVRPDPLERKLVAFDPWNSHPIIKAPWLEGNESLSATDIRIIRSIIPEGATVFDIGASSGAWSRTLHSINNNCNIYCFEEEPLQYSILASWAEITASTSIAAVKAHVSPHKNSSTIYFRNPPQFNCTNHTPSYQNLAQSHLTQHRKLISIAKETEEHSPVTLIKTNTEHTANTCTIPTETWTIDDFCTSFRISHINFLKICKKLKTLDALQGAMRLIGHTRIDIIQIENNHTQNNEQNQAQIIFHLLNKSGYMLFGLNEHTTTWEPKWVEYRNSEADTYIAIHARLAPHYGVGIKEMPILSDLAIRHGLNIRGVIHVGAHHGEEVDTYRSLGAPHIVMVEANPSAFIELSRRHNQSTDITLVNCAISDTNGICKLHLSDSGNSSPLLKPELVTSIDPSHTFGDTIEIRCTRLDDLFIEITETKSSYNILRISAQGAELLVLRGANELLEYIDIIYLDIYYAELYSRCPQIEEVDDYITALGYKRIWVVCPFHKSWGGGVYLRETAPVVYRTAISCQIGCLAELVATHLGVRRHGCFVEVGAFDGETWSNTSFLADLGWRGLCIEAIPAYARTCMTRHSRSPLVDVAPVAAGSTAGWMDLWEAEVITTGDATTAAIYREIPWTKDAISKATLAKVRSERLETLLERYNITPCFDILNISVCGQEMEVLDSFDLTHWRPRLLIIGMFDAHPDFNISPMISQRGAIVRQHIKNSGYHQIYHDNLNTIFAKT